MNRINIKCKSIITTSDTSVGGAPQCFSTWGFGGDWHVAPTPMHAMPLLYLEIKYSSISKDFNFHVLFVLCLKVFVFFLYILTL